ncbi:hypothetical protein COLO4_30193 [Corchorus olitorius]|uniref:Uncharacterized protein n=1 Tax=Corchorus olitorius TaxID=93759 RepID=A0A1R3HAE3_9ROSI|nr:hypothetical protein COLO4_30193 [Corchorus olitorius]
MTTKLGWASVRFGRVGGNFFEIVPPTDGGIATDHQPTGDGNRYLPTAVCFSRLATALTN